MTGRTNAAAASGFAKGGDVLVSHSAGGAGMTDHGPVTLADGDFRLLEIRQSGTLTFHDNQLAHGIPCELCLVGGGENGHQGGAGGCGGEVLSFFSMLGANLTVVIGAGGSGMTSVSGGAAGSTRAAGFSGSYPLTSKSIGGSGGGGQRYYEGGAGLLQSTYPFRDLSHFSPHAGGGGGGGYYSSRGPVLYAGGAGGTTGSGGNPAASGESYAGGAAGDSSAGAGGARSGVGGNAAYYGGGGGGGGRRGSTEQAGGSGYQGVIWIRIPA